jgi:hypothetical protein
MSTEQGHEGCIFEAWEVDTTFVSIHVTGVDIGKVNMTADERGHKGVKGREGEGGRGKGIIMIGKMWMDFLYIRGG